MAGASAQQLRQMTDLAGRLKSFSEETTDPDYASLFLKAAEDILRRAGMLAVTQPPIAEFQQGCTLTSDARAQAY